MAINNLFNQSKNRSLIVYLYLLVLDKLIILLITTYSSISANHSMPINRLYIDHPVSTWRAAAARRRAERRRSAPGHGHGEAHHVVDAVLCTAQPSVHHLCQLRHWNRWDPGRQLAAAGEMVVGRWQLSSHFVG